MSIERRHTLLRQPILVPQVVSVNTTVTGQDAYKAWTHTVNGTITFTLPQAIPGRGPFYFLEQGAANVIVVAPANSTDEIVGNAPGASVTLNTTGQFLGLFCALTGFWSVIATSNPSSGFFTGFANPTVKVGLVAVNGTATTAMRSDSAPALDQTISPTMTGNWTFTPASGVAITINAAAAGPAILVQKSGSDLNALSAAAAAGFQAIANFRGNGNSTTAGLIIGQSGSGLGQLTQEANLDLQISTNNTVRWVFKASGGLISESVVGASGDQGIGTLNASGLFVLGEAAVTGPKNQITSDATFSNAVLSSTGMPSVTVQAGTYLIVAQLLIYEATVGTGGAQFDLGGGSAGITSIFWSYSGNVNGTAVSSSAMNSATTAVSFGTVTTTPTAPNVVNVTGTVVFSGTGTFKLRGAQASLLGADPTHFVAGSYVQLIRTA